MTNDEIRMTKEDPNDECSKHHKCREIGRNLASTPNWRLEAAITGTLGSVPLHRGGRHLGLPVSGGFQPRDPFAVVRVPRCASANPVTRHMPAGRSLGEGWSPVTLRCCVKPSTN